MRSSVTVLALATLVPTLVGAQEPAPPLFAEQGTLLVTIEADFRQLRDDRDEENEERPGTFTFADGTTLPVDIRTRGNFRLRSGNCPFPPLRLDFPKGQLAATILDGQDKLKLVTHCRDRDDFEQNTLQEFLAYRVYNLVSDLSFRVRPARITYVDSGGREDTIERWAFIIEHEDGLAARLGAEILEPEGMLHPARVRGATAAPLNLFQYLIGNTDYSIYETHNVVLLETPETVIPVPYDFDWSGLVNASYARPDPSLGIRNVRDRVFRGLCRPDIDFPALFARFQELRPEIEGLVRDQEGMDDRSRRESLEYIEGFYDILDSERRRTREIVEGCRSV